MATYPALPVNMSSRVQVLDEIKISRARGGQPRARRWFSATRIGKFEIVHTGLTNAQRDELETFLRVNRTATFLFLWPYGNASYTVIWGDSELVWDDIGGLLSSTRLTLIPVL